MITLTVPQLSRIARTCDIDVEEEVRTDYSGRSMYGKTCLGYTGGSLVEFVAAVALILIEDDPHAESDDAWTLLEKIAEIGDGREDSMGRGRITYWPGITVAEVAE